MHFLKFGPMDENELIEYLGEMEKLETELPEMLLNAYNRIDSLEECIRRNSFHGIGDGSSAHNVRGDTVYYTLMSVYREVDGQIERLAEEVMKILEGQEKLEYIKNCIRMLPRDQSDLIMHLFIAKESRESYAKMICVSRATLGRKRKRSLGNLLIIYNGKFKETGRKSQKAPKER